MEKQIFAIQLAGYLIEKYPLTRRSHPPIIFLSFLLTPLYISLEIARMIIGRLRVIHSNLGDEDPAAFLLQVLPSLTQLVKAFPSFLVTDAINLLQRTSPPSLPFPRFSRPTLTPRIFSINRTVPVRRQLVASYDSRIVGEESTTRIQDSIHLPWYRRKGSLSWQLSDKIKTKQYYSNAPLLLVLPFLGSSETTEGGDGRPRWGGRPSRTEAVVLATSIATRAQCDALLHSQRKSL